MSDALPSLWRALRVSLVLAFRAQPALLVLSLVTKALTWAPGSLHALWGKFLVDGALARDRGRVIAGCAGVVATVSGQLLVIIAGNRLIKSLQDRAGLALQQRLLDAAGGLPGLEHQERPDYVDRLQMLRQDAWFISWMFEALSELLGSLVQVAILVVLLARLDLLMLVLPLLAVPPILAARRARTLIERAETAGGQHLRRTRHLFDIATSPAAGKELRVFGVRTALAEMHRRYWRRMDDILLPAQRAQARLVAGSAALYAIGFAATFLLLISRAVSGRATPGDVLLALMLGREVTWHISMVVEMYSWTTGLLHASARFVWLMDLADADPRGTRAAPEPIKNGITFEDVSFTYPATDREILSNVSLHIPAGASIAIVGHNGAGKTTLVKLLGKFYAPTSGRILIDGVDLADIETASWRARLSAAFQDFAKLEFVVREAVGVGDVARVDDPAAVTAAMHRASTTLRLDLEQQLGTRFAGGRDLSGGQWQQVALARAMMRRRPAVLILGEPTASLDAQTEHDLFSRYADAAKQQGTTTILVSHRFSTVRMADTIVVLDGARIAEHGTHDELMSGRGVYAELYELQARAYRS